MNIICLGDSTTYGYMISRNKVWSNILNSKFTEDNKDIKFINKGINGDMISGMLSRFDIDCINNNPDKVILMAGVNDIFTCRSLEKIKDDMIGIINKAIKNNIDIIVFSPIPFIKKAFTFFEASNMIDEFENVLIEYIDFIKSYTKENNIKYINTYDIFINNILKYNNYYDIYFDGVHLNENGHHLFALEIYKELKYLLI
ncbi:GDSL-type esterase/lipase family protein [Brachyspira sp.]|uniref:GDSL-type esterase/lipase family protein n=1 Tax=Brachyspira sp. TaxID=1977261 RepID=UPI0026092006|nr:GDSL-type esterase/lipase family protein [Brachyspira sp.]